MSATQVRSIPFIFRVYNTTNQNPQVFRVEIDDNTHIGEVVRAYLRQSNKQSPGDEIMVIGNIAITDNRLLGYSDEYDNVLGYKIFLNEKIREQFSEAVIVSVDNTNRIKRPGLMIKYPYNSWTAKQVWPPADNFYEGDPIYLQPIGWWDNFDNIPESQVNNTENYRPENIIIIITPAKPDSDKYTSDRTAYNKFALYDYIKSRNPNNRKDPYGNIIDDNDFQAIKYSLAINEPFLAIRIDNNRTNNQYGLRVITGDVESQFSPEQSRQEQPVEDQISQQRRILQEIQQSRTQPQIRPTSPDSGYVDPNLINRYGATSSLDDALRRIQEMEARTRPAQVNTLPAPVSTQVQATGRFGPALSDEEALRRIQELESQAPSPGRFGPSLSDEDALRRIQELESKNKSPVSPVSLAPNLQVGLPNISTVRQPSSNVLPPLPSLSQVTTPGTLQSYPSFSQPLPSIVQPLPSIAQPLSSIVQPLPLIVQPLPSLSQPNILPTLHNTVESKIVINADNIDLLANNISLRILRGTNINDAFKSYTTQPVGDLYKSLLNQGLNSREAVKQILTQINTA